MRKILDITEVVALTTICFVLIGIMIFEHWVYTAIEIFESGWD